MTLSRLIEQTQLRFPVFGHHLPRGRNHANHVASRDRGDVVAGANTVPLDDRPGDGHLILRCDFGHETLVLTLARIESLFTDATPIMYLLVA